jgi:hypothetical protein
MPDRPKVMTQTKRYNLGLGMGVGLTTPPHKKCSAEKLLKEEATVHHRL